MDRDRTLKKMTDLLLSKARMLPYHCGKCKTPLFEKDEKIICPVCGEITFDEEKEKKSVKAEKTKVKTDSKLTKILRKKRDELISQIDAEKNPKKLVSLLEALEMIDKSL